MKHGIRLLLITILLWPAAACHDMYSDLLDSRGLGVFIVAPPVMAGLSALSDSNSILLAPPVLISGWLPAPTITAYIGEDGSIGVTGSVVTGSYTQRDFNASAGGYLFDGLTMGATYRIIVVAQNALGSSVQQIVKATYNPTAVGVYGQGATGDNFTAGGSGVGRTFLNYPAEISVNASGIYVADSSNCRAVYYSFYDIPFDTSADRVYGQGGIFTTNIQDYPSGSVNAQGFNRNYGIAVDASGVYITDSNNNRVLYFLGDSTTPTRVYGQGASGTNFTSNTQSTSSTGLRGPQHVAIDAGGVYIADTANHRVLYYEGNSTTSTRVYGQGGSFETGELNKNGISANSLHYPYAVAIDVNGVYIVDNLNHRVLYYEGTSTTAMRVYGQGASGTNFTSNGSATSETSLNGPTGVAFDASGVYIADCNNNRVLHYWGTNVTATGVYGQGGNLTSVAINQGAGAGFPTATSLYYPWGLAVYNERLYIVDRYNNRVLWY